MGDALRLADVSYERAIVLSPEHVEKSLRVVRDIHIRRGIRLRKCYRRLQAKPTSFKRGMWRKAGLTAVNLLEFGGDLLQAIEVTLKSLE